MSDAGGDIIIKGGSVQLLFDRTLYQSDPSDMSRHSSASMEIRRIRVVDEKGDSVFDSGDHTEALKWKIEVSCGHK